MHLVVVDTLLRINNSFVFKCSFWLNPAVVSQSVYDELPQDNPHKARHAWLKKFMPPDTYFMSGFDGQYVFIVPSLELVIVRLGFTEDSAVDITTAEGATQGSPRFSRPQLFGTIADLIQKRR